MNTLIVDKIINHNKNIYKRNHLRAAHLYGTGHRYKSMHMVLSVCNNKYQL